MAQVEKKKKCPLGLKTDSDNPVPLKSIKVDVNITGCVAEVTSNLTYFNEEKDPVEAAFTFPVDDGSAVFQFEAEIDGRHIVAEIQEKEQAQMTYHDAIDQNKTAMLLKEDDSAGDIFSCMLGNLPPESEASLLMKYVIELPQEADGGLRFTLPTILNPRYSPDFGGKIAAEDATYVPPSKVPYGFSMSASVRGYHKVTSVTSDRLKLYVEYGQNNEDAKVTLDDDFNFDHDLCLLVQYERPYLPQVVLETGNPDAEGLLKDDMLMVSFHPDLQKVALATNGEYIFVIDRSGSMSGSKINNAKEALFLFLKSLPSHCYFNVVSFGSSDKFLFPEGSKQYSKQSLEEATNLYRQMSADMEGTEILRPLEKIFKNKLIAGHPRSVIVITDGEVSNTDQVIGLVRKEAQSSGTRVLSLGIGYGASSSLIKGLANSGRGKAEFIAGGDRIQAKVISLLECAMQPAITDITLEWRLPKGLKPITIPTEPPSLISAGERLSLFAVLQGLDEQKEYIPSSVTLKGKQCNKDVLYSMTFVLCKSEEVNKSAPIHRLATKTQIKLLQGQESAYDFKGELKQEIINLSRHGNIISKYAAFVAVDTKGQKVEGKSLQRPCPVPSLSYEYTDLFDSDWSYDIDGDMYENIDRVMVRGEEMDNLEEKAEILAMSRSAFGQKAQEKSHMFGGFFSSLKNIITRSAPKHKVYEDSNTATCSREADIYENCEVSTGSSRVKSKSMYDSLPLYKARENESRNFDACSPIAIAYENGNDSTGSGRVDVYCNLAFETPPDCTSRVILYPNFTMTWHPTGFTDNQMLSVIALQQLHGEWEISKDLLHLLGIQKSDIRNQTFSKDSTVVCTVIAVCWLRKHFSRRKDEWKMIEMKALTWLASQNLPLPTEAIIQQARLALWP